MQHFPILSNERLPLWFKAAKMAATPTRRAPQFRGSTVVAEPRLARATSVGSPLGYLQPSRQPTAEASVDEAVVQVVTWSSLPACVGQVESGLFGEDSEMTRSRGFTAPTPASRNSKSSISDFDCMPSSASKIS